MLFLETFNYDDRTGLNGVGLPEYPVAPWAIAQDQGKPATIVDGTLYSALGQTTSDSYRTAAATFPATSGQTTVLGNQYVAMVGVTFTRSTFATAATGNVTFQFLDPNGHAHGMVVRVLNTGINNGRVEFNPSDTPTPLFYTTSAITPNEPHAAWVVRTGDSDGNIYLDGALLGAVTFADPDPSEDSFVQITIAENTNCRTACHFALIESLYWLGPVGGENRRVIYDGRTPAEPGSTFNAWAFQFGAGGGGLDTLTVYLQQGPVDAPTYKQELTNGATNSSGFKVFSTTIPIGTPDGAYYIGVASAVSGTTTASESFEVATPTAGGGLGSGDVTVDHNYGTADAQRVLASDATTPVDSAIIRAYVATDYTAGVIDPNPPLTITGSDGRWVNPLNLDADGYKMSVYNPVTKRTKLFDLTVA